MLNVSIYLLLGILIITSILMVLIVLMQRPKNEGLGAAFGGGMTQDLFGAQTTNVLQKFTVYLGAAFFGSCLLLTILYSKSSTKKSEVQMKLATSAAVKKAVPAPSATPASAATTTPTATPEAVVPIVTETPAVTDAPVMVATPTPAPAETPVPTATP